MPGNVNVVSKNNAHIIGLKCPLSSWSVVQIVLTITLSWKKANERAHANICHKRLMISTVYL